MKLVTAFAMAALILMICGCGSLSTCRYRSTGFVVFPTAERSPLSPLLEDAIKGALTPLGFSAGAPRALPNSNPLTIYSIGGSKIFGERVDVIAEGLELEYDMPNSATADDRAKSWQFPARVFRPFDGPGQLLNGPELETRVDAWLKAAGLPRTACGQWYFTWNAFRVECDPQSVLKTVQAFDLRSADVREGAAYQESAALGAGTLARKAGGIDGAVFTVEMPVEPDTFRRARAESDVVVGEIMKKPVSLDAALSHRATEIISGTISITFETDSGGNVRRRTKVIKLDIKGPDGPSETETVTEKLERRVISRGY
jgi:hypothetical protein